jgi:methyl-accepting chemotaxis protein
MRGDVSMEFLDNTKIGTKLIAGFLIIAALLGVVAVLGYMNMKNINDGMTTMYFDRLLPMDQIGNSESAFYLVRGDIYKYVAIPEQRDAIRKSINEGITKIDEEIEKYRGTNLLDSEIEELKVFDKNWDNYKTLVTEHLAMADQGKEKEVIQSLGSGAMTEARKGTGDALANLINLNRAEAERINTEADITFTASVLLITVVGIIGVVAAIALGFIISRSITIPLKKVGEILSEMSLGHLGNRLAFTRKDEIGIMSQSMDSFSDDLQNTVIGGMNMIAAGDLTLNITPKDDRDEISPALAKTVTTLQELVKESAHLSGAAISGELKTRGDLTRFEGGYRQILEGVNNTLDAIIVPVNEAMRLSSSYASGDFTDRVNQNLEINGDFIAFRDALNQIGIQSSQAISGVKIEVESLTAGMEETNASTEEVASTANTLAQSSSSVSMLAERSSNGVSQTLRAMDDLSNTVGSVASKAEQASAMAKQTVDLSEKGVTLAGKAEKGMEGIMESVDQTSGIIIDITSQMEEIGKIVDVITGIAEQTGLLALNAAIEAARAGDAGMGFAVVADEVKSLALESQKSAENIAGIIGNLQKKSQLVSDSMKVSAAEVKTGNEAVSETLQVFNQIVEAINVVHNNMTEVAGATEEQAAAVEEITASVNEVGTLVQQTAREAVDSAAATQEVTASIDQITRAISEAAASVQNISREMEKFTVT